MISSGQSIISITVAANGEILVGTQNGKLHVIDDTTFTESDEFSSAGRVMMGVYGDSGELYIISTFSSSSKIRLFDLDTDGDGVTDSQDHFRKTLLKQKTLMEMDMEIIQTETTPTNSLVMFHNG